MVSTDFEIFLGKFSWCKEEFQLEDTNCLHSMEKDSTQLFYSAFHQHILKSLKLVGFFFLPPCPYFYILFSGVQLVIKSVHKISCNSEFWKLIDNFRNPSSKRKKFASPGCRWINFLTTQCLAVDIVLTCRLIDLPFCVKYSLQNSWLVLNLSILYTLKDVQTFKLTVPLVSKGVRHLSTNISSKQKPDMMLKQQQPIH